MNFFGFVVALYPRISVQCGVVFPFSSEEKTSLLLASFSIVECRRLSRSTSDAMKRGIGFSAGASMTIFPGSVERIESIYSLTSCFETVGN